MVDDSCRIALNNPALQLWVGRHVQQNLDCICRHRSLANADAIKKAGIAPQAVAQREPILPEPRVSPEDVPAAGRSLALGDRCTRFPRAFQGRDPDSIVRR